MDELRNWPCRLNDHVMYFNLGMKAMHRSSPLSENILITDH